MPARPDDAFNTTRNVLLGLAGAWALAVCYGAASGYFASLYRPLIAVIVAATIVLPTLAYLASARLKALADHVGQRAIAKFHIWRIGAAIVFFWYGAHSALPPLFWILAGTGDLIAGGMALRLMFIPETASRYLRFHIFGFADFVVAVGTGLTYTLLLDPRMAPVIELPLALIPLFGVGISGVSHLVAFDMMRRHVVLTGSRSAARCVRHARLIGVEWGNSNGPGAASAKSGP